MVYTDEWNGYNRLPENNRGHATVTHTEPTGVGAR